jgi:SMC interacting uncharacterized protein involved in chromosome segregation
MEKGKQWIKPGTVVKACLKGLRHPYYDEIMDLRIVGISKKCYYAMLEYDHEPVRMKADRRLIFKLNSDFEEISF